MYIAPADTTLGEAEWRPFVEANSFGHLVAAGRNRDVPVVVPTQFVLEGTRSASTSCVGTRCSPR
jgi:transcriptional regulator